MWAYLNLSVHTLECIFSCIGPHYHVHFIRKGRLKLYAYMLCSDPQLNKCRPRLPHFTFGEKNGHILSENNRISDGVEAETRKSQANF